MNGSLDMAKKKPKVVRPRDPAWRTRRALGAKRIESGKAYRRAATRRAERAAAGPESDGKDP
jgi:hypothetical protein